MRLNPKDADLVTLVTFINSELGGRRSSPARSGYRGQFFYNNMDCDAIHEFDVEGEVPLGREIVDYIFLLNPDHRPRIREGMIFLVREGPNTVGYGQVIEVKTVIRERK